MKPEAEALKIQTPSVSLRKGKPTEQSAAKKTIRKKSGSPHQYTTRCYGCYQGSERFSDIACQLMSNPSIRRSVAIVLPKMNS
jgi:hypothetical protein